jgi:hypothetical protein
MSDEVIGGHMMSLAIIGCRRRNEGSKCVSGVEDVAGNI